MHYYTILCCFMRGVLQLMMPSKASGREGIPRPFLLLIWTLSPTSIGLQKEGYLASVCFSSGRTFPPSVRLLMARLEVSKSTLPTPLIVLLLVYNYCSSFRSPSHLSSSSSPHLPSRRTFPRREECHQEAINLGVGENSSTLSVIDSVAKMG
jgi:hypothetical protein